jgi:hypothetical protein
MVNPYADNVVVWDCEVVGYDLNVWDKGANDGEDSHWMISLHYLVEIEDGDLQTGEWIPEVEFHFTPEEVAKLTLGVDEEDGGLYIGAEDFFIQPEMFLEVYGDAVPARVREFVEPLVIVLGV